jgi:hypothetical protein
MSKNVLNENYLECEPSCQSSYQLGEQIERMEFITEVIKGVMQCSSEIQTHTVKLVIEALTEAEELGMDSNFRVTVEKKVIEHLLQRYLERTCEEVELYGGELRHLVDEAINLKESGHTVIDGVLGLDHE